MQQSLLEVPSIDSRNILLDLLNSCLCSQSTAATEPQFHHERDECWSTLCWNFTVLPVTWATSLLNRITVSMY